MLKDVRKTWRSVSNGVWRLYSKSDLSQLSHPESVGYGRSAKGLLETKTATAVDPKGFSDDADARRKIEVAAIVRSWL